MINYVSNHYARRLRRELKHRGFKDAGNFTKQYQERFAVYMSEADFGEANEKFSSYLNIFSGLACYELLRENGFSEEVAIGIYDYMCKTLRKVAGIVYRIADLFPNGFEITVNSLRKDMIGSKAVCWDTQILSDDDNKFEYRITKCLYYDTCKAHGYPEFTKVYCYHDRYAYDVLFRHAKFVRYSAIGEGGDCCHDVFVNVKKER